MDGVIKKKSIVIFQFDGEEKRMELGSAMPLSIGDNITLTGEGLDGKYELLEKKVDYKIEGNIHNLVLTYYLKKVA